MLYRKSYESSRVGRGFNSLDFESHDCFVSQSRGNQSIRSLPLNPYAPLGGLGDCDDGVWDKIGQAIRNLSLDYNQDDKDSPTPHWDIVSHILSQVRQKITLTISPDASAWRAEDIRSLNRAVHGHPIRLQVLSTAKTSPTNPWTPCIRHWQHCQLWNRLNLKFVNDTQGQRMNPLWLIPRA
jgi:hypothetical protein